MTAMTELRERTKELPVPLSLAEYKTLTGELTEHLDQIDHLQDSLDTYKKSVKDQVKKLEDEVQEVRLTLKNRFQMRDVACVEEWDFRSGVVTTCRKDTGEVVDSRMMEPAERQQCLQLTEREETLAERNQRLLEEEWRLWLEEEAAREAEENKVVTMHRRAAAGGGGDRA